MIMFYNFLQKNGISWFFLINSFLLILFQVTPKSRSVERSSSLFDPRFPTYIRAVIVCGVLLVVLLLVGAKFEFAKKMGWIKFRKKGAPVISILQI